MANKTCWKELPGKWRQKAYCNDKGLPVYTYHYGNALQPATKILELETESAIKLCSFTLIEKDLRDILLLLGECEEIYARNDLDFNPNRTPKDGIVLKGLISAIIVHYFRCFPRSNGRKYKLQQDKISNENLQTHLFLKDMRDKYIAHSDKSLFEECKTIFLVPPNKKIIKDNAIAVISCELYQAIGGRGLIALLQKLVTELHTGISGEIDQITDEIQNDIHAIPQDKLYKFMDKSTSKSMKNLLCKRPHH